MWIAPFEVISGSRRVDYNEAIELKKHLNGSYLGHIIPHETNYPRLKRYAELKPLRIRGTLGDNSYFSGIWYHPIENYRYCGTFQLL